MRLKFEVIRQTYTVDLTKKNADVMHVHVQLHTGHYLT
jgi:hypothetical protein